MQVPPRPMLKPWYRVLVERDRVLVEFAGTLTAFEGAAVERLLPALLPLLDGSRTLAEVVEELGAAAEPAVRAALGALARAGALVDGPLPAGIPGETSDTGLFLAAAVANGSGPAGIVEALARSRVALVGRDRLVGELADRLGRSGVGSIESFDPRGLDGTLPPVDLVVALGLAVDRLDQLNRAALEQGTSWLAAQPFDGRMAVVGPLVVPRESCCWQCLRLRRAATSGYADEHLTLERVDGLRLAPPAVQAIVDGLTATLALRWLAASDPALPGVLWTLELWPSIALEQHVVYRVPRCQACSDTAGAAPPSPWAEADAA